MPLGRGGRLLPPMAVEALTAIILAGERGERLGGACVHQRPSRGPTGRSASALDRDGDYVAKLLLPVGPELLLEHQLGWLRAAGFEIVVLCLRYKADEVRARFGDGSRHGVRLRYSIEEGPLGSAGAVKALGPASLPEDFLVLHGDLYADGNLRAMLKSHRERKALATLAVHDCPGLKGHAGCRRAVLGPSRAIVELPAAPTAAGATGLSPLWILNRSLLHLAGGGGPSDFIRDVFPAALRRGEPIFGHPFGGVLVDVESAEEYAGLLKRLGVARKARKA